MPTFATKLSAKIGMVLGILFIAGSVFGGVALAADLGRGAGPESSVPVSGDSDPTSTAGVGENGDELDDGRDDREDGNEDHGRDDDCDDDYDEDDDDDEDDEDEDDEDDEDDDENDCDDGDDD